ncbi:Glycosyltransferase involved in cell wall bisynthesis [Tistlia consotensis]|uniref:Glycosyltransferase involved in cell wall bisynthesis n=1 Tax=Tistlia consotensis USBA 355 TaxID=560819 RepID=A0A1Y6CLC8_9PROT|nr:glycosyltransferase [Tistlia consotensis]SMF71764.1 Glycosyltransferase involved in cell wall bisynthesis [Tistlia consotensis USBA 355]SNS06345.1 Glycosyltransferase involved in cell wall bisynthesis [Tistlia consotensis]
MSAPEVSVILPVYNRAATVGAALASALGQQGPALEVVLVDDGSSDGLEAALAPFRPDSRLRVLRHPERRGAAAARNTAIAEARGPWLAFLDSDDEWRPGKLGAQLAALAAAGPGLSMALTAALLDRGAAGTEVRVPRTSPSCRDVILAGCTQSPGSTAVIARAAFERYGPFEERLERLDDWEWLLRFRESDDFLVVPEPLAVVHVHDFAGVEAVDRAAALIWHRHAPRVRKEGLRRLGSFAGAVLIERAFARLAAGRLPGAFGLLALGLALHGRGSELPARARRRLRRALKP